MAFSCLTHIFTTTASTPNCTHTGVIHRASLPPNHTSTFAPTPNMLSKAVAPSLLTGTTYREHVASSNPPREKTTEIEGEIRDNWVLESEFKDKDGWHVGYEQATQMTVKRKGRGAFMFEGAMMEGWGVEKKEGDEDEVEEGRSGAGRLEDGFEYRGWVDEEMAIVSTKGVERDVVGRVNVCRDEKEVEIGIERRNAMEGKRDSVGRALFWNKF